MPENDLICVDEASETDDQDMRAGSCANPVDIPAQELVVKGVLGGCSDTEGYCGGSGGEDVYRIAVAGPVDTVIEFLPEETEIDPILRVVRGDPCEEPLIEDTEVCAPIINEVPRRVYNPVANEDHYIIVDSRRGEGGAYAFRISFGVGEVGNDCLEALEEEMITLGVGGQFIWEGSLDSGQGTIDSHCAGQGDEDIFPLTAAAGTLSVQVEALDGGAQPVASVRSGCAGNSELACGANISDSFGALNAYIAVDNQGVDGGRYRMTVSLD